MLQVDANSAYTLADIDLLRKLDDYNLLLIEQPLGKRRHLRSQQAAARAQDADLPRRKHPFARRCECRARAAELPGRQHQASARRRLSRNPNASTICAHRTACRSGTAGCSSLGIGRAGNVALASLPNFYASRRHLCEQALLPPGHRRARVHGGRQRDDDGADQAGDRRRGYCQTGWSR